ncbi:uncharacterized protein E0L32_002486 [Thyridium curvatum]|uniref:CCHC-type domain-containing protein n=1 Tax=Thyridium curvatum TaxID=1093900 RepID=A0A507BMA0_9PEZI|nr:uncharacterized protein E0L32_002486 [Thyridium curvatum]TPX18629.1 hypothetical protein E0L32_002486 [Thyridium curvatum]
MSQNRRPPGSPGTSNTNSISSQKALYGIKYSDEEEIEQRFAEHPKPAASQAHQAPAQPLVPPHDNASASRAPSGLRPFAFPMIGTSGVNTMGTQRSGDAYDVFMFAIPGGGHAFVLPSNNPSATYEPGRHIAMGELIAPKGMIKISWRPLANRFNTAYRRRKHRHLLREPVPVNVPDPVRTCANCGQEGHTLQICVKPGPDGDLRGCPRCNTLDHVYDFCKNNKHKHDEDVFYLITSRGNRPQIRTVLKWIDIAARMNTEPLHRPWSKAYATVLYHAPGRKYWDKGNYDYRSDDARFLPEDPDTGTTDGFATACMEGRLNQEFFVKPTEQLINSHKNTKLAAAEREVEELKAKIARAEAALKEA